VAVLRYVLAREERSTESGDDNARKAGFLLVGMQSPSPLSPSPKVGAGSEVVLHRNEIESLPLSKRAPPIVISGLGDDTSTIRRP